MSFAKNLKQWLVPSVQRTSDGREKWPSRTAFILASCGGAVGIGNLLRFPSIAFKHNGLQWFIPYFVALFLIGIPILIMEVSFGQAHRGGAVKSYGKVSPRLRGVGLSTVFIGYTVATYYVTIMSWVLTYFRNSFISPLPWTANNKEFFNNDVVGNPPPDKSGYFFSYSAHGIVGETLGWTLLSWLLAYLSIFRGVSVTGRVVYLTMLVPLFMILVITVRAVTLENARRGILLYVGSWSWSKLFSGKTWMAAVIQGFFGTAVGFGFYTAYSSHNSQFANAVQDSYIIAASNCIIEIVAGFAAFAIVGHLDQGSSAPEVSTFDLGFLTYPAAIARLPGGNAWGVLFFLTLYLLGLDSLFAMLEGVVTAVLDTGWGKKLPRMLSVALVTLTAAIPSIMYSTRFGKHLFTAVDKWLMEATLLFAMWLQCSFVTSIYRYKDVVSQTGLTAYAVSQCSYFVSMILGVTIGRTVVPAAGGGLFAGVLVIGTLVAAGISNTPEISGPWGTNRYVNSLWWLTCYSGHQLMKDLNAVVARGKNWRIPVLWAPLLRWFSAPCLIIVLSLAYEEIGSRMRNPMEIFGFIVAHVGVAIAAIGIIIPTSMNVWVAPDERKAHEQQYSAEPGETVMAPDGIDFNLTDAEAGGSRQGGDPTSLEVHLNGECRQA